MSKLIHKRHYAVEGLRMALGSNQMPYGFSLLGHSIPYYSASFTAEQEEGQQVKIWFNGCSRGINDQPSFEAFEAYLKNIYWNVWVTGHTVNLTYDDPVALTEIVKLTGDKSKRYPIVG